MAGERSAVRTTSFSTDIRMPVTGWITSPLRGWRRVPRDRRHRDVREHRTSTRRAGPEEGACDYITKPSTSTSC